MMILPADLFRVVVLALEPFEAQNQYLGCLIDLHLLLSQYKVLAFVTIPGILLIENFFFLKERETVIDRDASNWLNGSSSSHRFRPTITTSEGLLGFFLDFLENALNFLLILAPVKLDIELLIPLPLTVGVPLNIILEELVIVWQFTPITVLRITVVTGIIPRKRHHHQPKLILLLRHLDKLGLKLVTGKLTKNTSIV